MVKKIVHLADIHIRTFRMHDEYKDVFKNLLTDLKELLSDYKREEISRQRIRATNFII